MCYMCEKYYKPITAQYYIVKLLGEAHWQTTHHGQAP